MAQPQLVLHLSDLHFGPHSRFASVSPRALAERFHQAIEGTRRDLGFEEKVSLMVVTGDIAEAARPKEYEVALAFFRDLTGHMGLAAPRVVFVPGNHDISWTECKRAELDFDDGAISAEELELRIHANKLRLYEEFLRAFYDADRASLPGVLSLGHGAYVHAFPELELAVAALNSCEVESHRTADHRGVIRAAQAQALMSHFRQSEARRWLKIVAVHHNPVVTAASDLAGWRSYLSAQIEANKLTAELVDRFMADAVGFEGRDLLRRIADDCRAQVVLHGHNHASGREAWTWEKAKGQTHVLSAGSFGLKADMLPEGHPLAIQLVRLDPAAEEARAVLRVYEPRARASGFVEPGDFTVDAASPEGVTLHMSLPEGFRATAASGASAGARPTTLSLEKNFVHEYRTRLRTKYVRWDLAGVGAVQTGGAGRPIEATLDSMYVPLRLGETYDVQKINEGAPLDPKDLLVRKRPLVICGAAGSGKTTLMRWMFRKLISEEGALPFMIELRALAHAWSKAERGAERTLDVFLRNSVAQTGAAGWGDALSLALKSVTGPRPVLLIDGWDEIGQIGETLREQLTGFLAVHPRAFAIVTSRPYGESRPSKSEGFDKLEIQPLSDEDIAMLAGKFYRQVYGEDEQDATRSTGRFKEALNASPEAKSLARTALLLTMMLLISRDRPLPDKRHRLYDECLKNLLSARPDRKEEEGARLSREQWRPNDSEERLRAVAAMAFQMQQAGYQRSGRAPIMRPWADLEKWLPGGWKAENRSGFLAWLVGPAGVMVDRTDGMLAFAHLSFQEYLTALHLSTTMEGTDERTKLCRDRASLGDWWETLRLWAAIVGDRNPEHLRPVLEGLIKGDAPHYWLAGAMLADGQGEEVFDAWIRGMSTRLHTSDIHWSEMSARAWATSRQEERRDRIAGSWADLSGRWTWFQEARAEAFWKEARLPGEDGSHNVLETLMRESSEGRGVGRGRMFVGASPFWPGDPIEIVLLRLWPARRVHEGIRLQTLASLGADTRELSVEHQRARSNASADETERYLEFVGYIAKDIARYVARYADREVTHEVARDGARDIARYVAQDIARKFAGNRLPSAARDGAWSSSQHRVLEVARDVARDYGWDLVRDVAQYFTRYLTPFRSTPETAVILGDFALVEMCSAYCRATTRSFIAKSPETDNATLSLLRLACRHSIRPHSDRTPLLRDLEAWTAARGDPLWSALARHIARISTPEDRALLEHLARNPNDRAAPLSWGLRYYVRGDLVLRDGSEVTLDAISDDVGLPRLPVLEDMHDEIKVD